MNTVFHQHCKTRKTEPVIRTRRHLRFATFYTIGLSLARFELIVTWLSLALANYDLLKGLPGGESNPGLPRDRRGYSPLYYRGCWHINPFIRDALMNTVFHQHCKTRKTEPVIRTRRHLRFATFYTIGLSLARFELIVTWLSLALANYDLLKGLPGGESNPGVPRDRRGYSPLYYRGCWHINPFIRDALMNTLG